LSCGSKDDLIHISQATHAFLKRHDVPLVWHMSNYARDQLERKSALWHFMQRIFR
jgi:hypothetical protein